jgi:hypothetical protein
MNEPTPYAGTYSIPQPYWVPSAEPTPYSQQPPTAYYQPYDYQAIQPHYPGVFPSPSTPISKTPANKPTGPLPLPPLGRTPRESNMAYTSLAVAPQPIVPAFIPQPVIPPPPPPIPPPPRRIYHHRRSSPSPYYHYDRSSLPPYVTFFFD